MSMNKVISFLIIHFFIFNVADARFSTIKYNVDIAELKNYLLSDDPDSGLNVCEAYQLTNSGFLASLENLKGKPKISPMVYRQTIQRKSAVFSHAGKLRGDSIRRNQPDQPGCGAG